MRPADQFHAGVVVEDLAAAQSELSELAGYRWCEPMTVTTPVFLPTDELAVELTFAYSMSVPRLELIESIPDTLWLPVAGSGIHHLGYWSDDVDGDSTVLAGRGAVLEAGGAGPDGSRSWAYLRTATGVRIELVDRRLEEALGHYWATGKV